MKQMSQQEWVAFGIEQGWCSPVFCHVHDAPDLTELETVELAANDDDLDCLCIPSVRLY